MKVCPSDGGCEPFLKASYPVLTVKQPDAPSFAQDADPRVDVLGVSLTPMTLRRAGDIAQDAVASRRKLTAAFCTVHTIVESQKAESFRDAINNADIAATDGMPLLWLCRLRGAKSAERVYGPDTMQALCERGVALGWRHYFYGGSEEELAALTHRLQRAHPGIVVAGTHSPPFRALSGEEKQADADRINAAEPDLVWVGLGNPKQELWMAEFRSRLEAPLILAVGAAFAFHAGKVKQAPRWMQRSGTEWLFRLAQEPRRLWKRYLVCNTTFALLLAREALAGRRRL
jgi:N-acetylglucosaminyldiphosphoundecaprenol N-acetyl-beta-D-mannosaminyltransferase